ncbi:LacI family transcriptional regulator [Bordetella genomosp. 1]|uniref:LacI family transcriptional regulator n=1 Tax=Bordetella genomosp. 1 TaxID=1395607 RepID=A0A261SSC6_9BORD|nr:tripartite tricarboxylate transporter substrate binding protein [Bordetella genomosp. 1]MDQ8030407.1 tripartite tricarboxylate transporter substrate binding protein [Bordetella sp.]OZI40278.1 LacI family transcriptional regulator [Bordetella genomosp. 1]OZI68472.1 LacI family transcriptional regulator [Bordetella genomosp. 1]
MTILNALARRAVLAAGATLIASASAMAAYPERPVTLVVTYPPGGTVDVVARLIGPKLAEKLGQSVVIENRGGAGGMIGGAAVARAKPDGYTLMLDASNHAQNPALHSKMQFDTLADFAPVSLLLRVPNVLVVTPSAPINSVAELIKAGQDKSKPVYFASAGPGSAQHLAGELFNLLAHTHLEHVAYKGGGPAMVDVMAGQVPVMFASMGSAWQHVKNGKLRAVAVGGGQRSPAAPDLPTLAESGVPGYESYEWNAVFAPAGTPPEILDQVSKALAEVLKDPAIAASLAGIGAETIGSTPADLDTFRRAEIAKWQKVVKEANLKLD